MSWWSYAPRDFLMFAPRTYWRLVEIYNQDLWPWQPAVLAAGVALAWHAARRGTQAQRLACAALALAWLWVAWGFQWQRFATINWGASYLAAAGVLQAALLLVAALRAPGHPRGPPCRNAAEAARSWPTALRSTRTTGSWRIILHDPIESSPSVGFRP